MLNSQDDVNKAVVSVVVEKILLDMGKANYVKVINMLNKNYNCFLPDCYSKPEYLSAVLKELFGASSKIIVENIKVQLKEMIHQERIAQFVEVMSK